MSPWELPRVKIFLNLSGQLLVACEKLLVLRPRALMEEE